MKRAHDAEETEAKRAKIDAILCGILDGDVAEGDFPVLTQHVRAAQLGNATQTVRRALHASSDGRLQRLGSLHPTTVAENSMHTLRFTTQLPVTPLGNLAPASTEQLTPSGAAWTLHLRGAAHLRFGFCQPVLEVHRAVKGTYHITLELVGNESVRHTVEVELSPTQTTAALPSPFLTGAGEGFPTSRWVTDGYFRLQVTAVRAPTAGHVAAAVAPLLTTALLGAATKCWETRELLDHLAATVGLGPLLRRSQLRAAMDGWIAKHSRLLARLPPDQVPATPGHGGALASTASTGLQARIRKMLELGLHPETPEAEATRSMRRAQEMMAKHQLQQADLGLHRQELTGGLVKVTLGSGLPTYTKLMPVTVPQWIRSLMSVCSATFSPDRKAKVFHCIHRGRCPTVTFYGFREAAQLAAYAFQVGIDRIVTMKATFTPDMGGLATSGCQSKAAFSRMAKLTYCKGIVAALRAAIPQAEEAAPPPEAPPGSAVASTSRASSALALVVQHHTTVAAQVLREAGITVHTARRTKSYASFDLHAWTQGKTDGATLDLQQRALE